MVVPHWLIGQLPYSFTAKIWLFFPNPVFIYSNLPIPQVIFNFLNCSPENSCMHYNLVGWNDKLGTILSVVCLLVKCYVIIHYAKVRNAWDFSVLLVNVSKYYILFVYGVWTLMGSESLRNLSMFFPQKKTWNTPSLHSSIPSLDFIWHVSSTERIVKFLLIVTFHLVSKGW